MKRLCVFCGVSEGSNKQNPQLYIDQAKKVGEILADQKIGLVYGGATIGVMGSLANATLAKGGDVIGVIPKNLIEHEVAHHQVTKLHIVEDMHERKKMMYDFSDAFLILPGGMGTLDELFEILTWSQLKLHAKPIYILNEFGFYDFLLSYLRHSHAEGFIKKEHLQLINELKKVEDVLNIKF